MGEFIVYFSDVTLIKFLLFITEIAGFTVNSVDSDQTSRSIASELDQHCLPVFLLLIASNKWIRPSEDGDLVARIKLI